MKAEVEKRHSELKINIHEKINLHSEMLKKIEINAAEINQLQGALKELENVLCTLFQKEVDVKKLSEEGELNAA